jgi:charged multivesicular body protein 3
MEEMMEETLDSVDNDDELEEEADAEVDKVLFELTDGKLGQAGKVGSELPVSLLLIYIPTLHHGTDDQAQKEDEDESEEETARMRREMQELLSG